MFPYISMALIANYSS